MLEAYPGHFHAQHPTTSSSIYSGENYKAQSIQMYPTRLNTSWPDKQLLLCVTATTGKLLLKDDFGGGQARGGKASRDENIFHFMEILHFFLSKSDSAGAAAADHLTSFEDFILCLAAHKSFIMKLHKVRHRGGKSVAKQAQINNILYRTLMIQRFL